jgi:chromosome segregation ATPase
LSSLFANLTIEQKEKINELIKSINKKDEILECQEDLLVKENKKIVKLKDAFALEVEKCKKLTKELKTSNDSISCLKTENASLIAKIEELNACHVPTSTIEHVTICTRCRDVDINDMNDHLAMIKEQNDHIAKLNAKIAEHELENEKFKFACSMLYNGRRPGIKDGIGFHPGSQNNIKLMPIETRFPSLLRARLPWCKI